MKNGIKNKIDITEIKKDVIRLDERLDELQKDHIIPMKLGIDKIYQDLQQRLPIWATIVIAILLGLLGFFAKK